METNHDLRHAQHNHLPGLLCICHAECNSRSGRTFYRYKSCVHQFSIRYFFKKKLKTPIFIALILGTAGVFYASWPLLQDATVTTPGLLLLLFSMFSYSVGAIYFSAKNWGQLSILTINGWQTFIGGILLLPFTLFFYKSDANNYNFTFWLSILWLAVPVSIFAVQLWLWLLRINIVKAGLWLFLCPVFGFAMAAPILGDPISYYTIIGVAMVMAGLFISQRIKH